MMSSSAPSPTPKLKLANASPMSNMFTARIVYNTGNSYDCHIEYIHTHSSIPKTLVLRRSTRSGEAGPSSKAPRCSLTQCVRVTPAETFESQNSLVLHFANDDGKSIKLYIRQWKAEMHSLVRILRNDAETIVKNRGLFTSPKRTPDSARSKRSAPRSGLVSDDLRERERKRHALSLAPASRAISRRRSGPARMPTGQSRRMLGRMNSSARGAGSTSGTSMDSFSAMLIGRPDSISKSRTINKSRNRRRSIPK